MSIRPLKWIEEIEEYNATSQDVWRVDDNSLLLKLDWNESTHVSDLVRQKLIEFLRTPGSINWYPDVSSHKLSRAIAKYINLSTLQILSFGGSDVALETMVRTYVAQNDCVAVVVPGYDNFRVFAESCGATVHGISIGLEEGYRYDTFLAKLENIPTVKIIYIINPNNPLGYYIPLTDITRLLKKFPKTAVIVDEAYIEFMPDNHSATSLINNFDNLFVVRSFSKAFGLAGLRLGYMVSAHNNLVHINKLRNGKNISMLAQIAGITLLENINIIDDHKNSIREARKWFMEAYRALNGYVWDSHANFVLIRVKNPQDVATELRAQGIYVRDRSTIHGLEDCLRITVGYKNEMIRVLEAFNKISPKLWQIGRSDNAS